MDPGGLSSRRGEGVAAIEAESWPGSGFISHTTLEKPFFFLFLLGVHVHNLFPEKLANFLKCND